MANRFHVKQYATLSAHPKCPKANTQQLRNVVCELALYCPVGSKCGWALGHSLVEHIGAAVGHCDVRQCGPQYAMGHLRTCHCTALRAQEEDELAFLQGNLALEEQVLNRRPSTCLPAVARTRTTALDSFAGYCILCGSQAFTRQRRNSMRSAPLGCKACAAGPQAHAGDA
jgi:hypothetical protein